MKKETSLKSKWTAAFFQDSWMWGKPEGLSDQPEEFLAFLNETDGIQYIPPIGVIRIGKLEEEDAERFVGFLRNPPIVLR